MKRRVVVTGLAVALVAACLSLGAPARALAQGDDIVAACEELLNEQWRQLSLKKTTAADEALDKARQLGCLRAPVASKLCHIPAAQQSRFEDAGNSFLANAARHQQESLGCLDTE